MGGLGGVMVGEEGEAGVERVTRGEHGGDGSTCDSGGRGSSWLSGAASVEGGRGGEREERDVQGTSVKCILIMTISFYTNHVHFRRSELQMTDIELRAIAAAAIHGCRVTPTGVRAPAAIGMPMKLYSTAHRKLDLIFLTVLLDSSIAEITFSKLL